MDSLIAVGSGSALVYGIFSLYKMIFAMVDGNKRQCTRRAWNCTSSPP